MIKGLKLFFIEKIKFEGVKDIYTRQIENSYLLINYKLIKLETILKYS